MVAKRKNYPPEFKRDALDLVHSSKDRSVADIARGLGIHLETLRKWIRDDKARREAVDGGSDAGMTAADKDELKRLRRENARLREDNEILRKAAAYFARETTR